MGTKARVPPKTYDPEVPYLVNDPDSGVPYILWHAQLIRANAERDGLFEVAYVDGCEGSPWERISKRERIVPSTQPIHDEPQWVSFSLEEWMGGSYVNSLSRKDKDASIECLRLLVKLAQDVYA